MISAFDVYLVMQVDKICNAAEVAAVLSSAVTGIGALAAFLSSVDELDAFAKASKKVMKAGIVALVISLPVYVFTPSSKTVAAMILVPALTSDEVVEPVAAEAKELYTLAKDALRELAKPEDKDED